MLPINGKLNRKFPTRFLLVVIFCFSQIKSSSSPFISCNTLYNDVQRHSLELEHSTATATATWMMIIYEQVGYTPPPKGSESIAEAASAEEMVA